MKRAEPVTNMLIKKLREYVFGSRCPGEWAGTRPPPTASLAGMTSQGFSACAFDYGQPRATRRLPAASIKDCPSVWVHAPRLLSACTAVIDAPISLQAVASRVPLT